VRPPCHGCPDRHELCHAECEKYREFRMVMDRRCAEREIIWCVRSIRSDAVVRRMRDAMKRQKRGRAK